MRRLLRAVAAFCLGAQLAAIPAAAAPADGPAPAVPAPVDTVTTPVRVLVSRMPEPRRHTWGIVGSGLGLATGAGLAVWLKSEADDRYHRYRRTADPVAARDLFDEAERYDRASLVGWTLAEVSFVALFYFLTREPGRSLVPVRGEPLIRTDEDGVQVGLKVAP